MMSTFLIIIICKDANMILHQNTPVQQINSGLILLAQIIFSSRRSVRFLLLDVGPGRRCVLKELTNFEHVPHFIGELSANCSPTFITMNMANFEAFLLYFITMA